MVKESEVMWAVAVLQPATVREVEDLLSVSYSSNTLLKLWRDGLLVRRKKLGSVHGKNPYEYGIKHQTESRPQRAREEKTDEWR